MLEVQAKQKSRKRGCKAVHDTDDATRGAGASRVGAAGEVEPEGQGGSPTTGRGAGVIKNGRLVSVADGHTLSRFNNLRKSFLNSYHSVCNPRLGNGQKLDPGQAFKLACFVHYGPRMPYDKSGDLETRKALFHTATYYSMSIDGADEEECLNSSEFGEFMTILVACAKQMKYQSMPEGRVFFGDKVFTTHRASKQFQSEYLPVLRIFSKTTHVTQFCIL